MSGKSLRRQTKKARMNEKYIRFLGLKMAISLHLKQLMISIARYQSNNSTISWRLKMTDNPHTKPRIKKISTNSTWPGAMDFEIEIGDRYHWLSVDSFKKLDWYIEKLTHNHNFPCGIDYG